MPIRPHNCPVLGRGRGLGLALAALSLGLAHPGRAEAADALVAVAANFASAAKAIAQKYDAASGNHITLTVASTGVIAAQVLKGAPFDVMLSADATTPEVLGGEGGVVRGGRFTYAVGKLALWAPGASQIADPAAYLGGAGLAHLAIANPKLAPYGQAAEEALQAMGIKTQVAGKIVMGQNIGQTFALVKSGAAPAGFIAYSSLKGLMAPKGGAIWLVPQKDYTPIRQDAALVMHGKDNPAAKGFLAFLKGKDAQAVKADYGYGPA